VCTTNRRRQQKQRTSAHARHGDPIYPIYDCNYNQHSTTITVQSGDLQSLSRTLERLVGATAVGGGHADESGVTGGRHQAGLQQLGVEVA